MLNKCIDVLVWEVGDMEGMSTDVVFHNLLICGVRFGSAKDSEIKS